MKITKDTVGRTRKEIAEPGDAEGVEWLTQADTALSPLGKTPWATIDKGFAMLNQAISAGMLKELFEGEPAGNMLAAMAWATAGIAALLHKASLLCFAWQWAQQAAATTAGGAGHEHPICGFHAWQ